MEMECGEMRGDEIDGIGDDTNQKKMSEFVLRLRKSKRPPLKLEISRAFRHSTDPDFQAARVVSCRFRRILAAL